MSTREFSPVLKDLLDVNIKRLPLGKAVRKGSTLSPDPQTTRSISVMREMIRDRGMLIFDAHKSEFDMMAVALQMGLNIPGLEQMIGPIAHKQTKTFLGKLLVEAVKSKKHLHLIPVSRSDDLPYLSKTELSQKTTTNEEYLHIMRDLLTQPWHLGIVAPYGSRKKSLMEQWLRWGAVDLAARIPFVCSLAAFDWRYGKYVVYLSQILTCVPSDSNQIIRSRIQGQFTEVDRRAHQRKNY